MPRNHNFDMVIFGATGDLAMRKLLPNLYRAHAAGVLHPAGRILGVSRSDLSRAAFLDKVAAEAKIHVEKELNPSAWETFLQRMDYLRVDVNAPEQFHTLAGRVRARENGGSVIMYLSTAPKFFAPACANLAAAGLNTPDVRIVLEKPLGSDLASSQAINAEVARYFQENQIYRIDHYLGKAVVQNLLPMRFANAFFEPVWNRDFIRSVQITIAETLGVEERGEFYDTTGALRDMVQNHLMQMLCFVAMERPASLAADDVRDEKLKLIRALKTMDAAQVAARTVRGQYAAASGSRAYTEEHNVPADSRTETYAAIYAEIDNPRWAGVPFYLRTGKRMAVRTTEIVINFKPLENGLFGGVANRLVISVQPDKIVRLRVCLKRDGSAMRPMPAEMVLDLLQAEDTRHAEAYELLLREVIAGKQTLFNRRDELEAAWAWVMPILNHWQDAAAAPPQPYAAGSWGPQAARDLLAANGDKWLEEQEY